MLTEGEFLGIVGNAVRSGGVEVTFAELVVAAKAEAKPLAAVPVIVDSLAAFGLALFPGVESGDLDTLRVLRRIPVAAQDEEDLSRELTSGEGATIEYKESLCHNHARAKADPTTSIQDLRSEEVLDSALKTVCGFLNAEGGVLLIGVADDVSVTGIEHDFPHTGHEESHRSCVDKWELFLRNTVRDRFNQGQVVNNYVRVSFHKQGGGTAARVFVSQRNRICALRSKVGGYAVFLRRGNRTDRLEPWEIEELVLQRRGLE